MAESPQGGSKFQVDSDWKAEARAEKAKLEEKVKAAEPKPGAAAAGPAAGSRAGREIPPASLDTLISNLASQALLFMGAIPDPRTGQRITHMELAKHHLDTLGIIADKTKGNLTEEESKLLSTTLYELRQAYIQILTATREQRKSGG
ncbi:MAG: DUF1844 domain-containing protein [Phycisphaeraceae bacterium]